MENRIKLMHGDLVSNNSIADCGKLFFVLNPCRRSTYSLDGEESDQENVQVVAQSLDDKGDFRYVSMSYFEDGTWFLINNKIELKE